MSAQPGPLPRGREMMAKGAVRARFRTMVAEDLDDVMAIEFLSYLTPWTLSAFEREFACINECCPYRTIFMRIVFSMTWLESLEDVFDICFHVSSPILPVCA